MLFISNNSQMKGSYVTLNKEGQYNMVYVFEKNKTNEDLLTKFRKRELTWGSNVIKFE